MKIDLRPDVKRERRLLIYNAITAICLFVIGIIDIINLGSDHPNRTAMYAGAFSLVFGAVLFSLLVISFLSYKRNYSISFDENKMDLTLGKRSYSVDMRQVKEVDFTGSHIKVIGVNGDVDTYELKAVALSYKQIQTLKEAVNTFVHHHKKEES